MLQDIGYEIQDLTYNMESSLEGKFQRQRADVYRNANVNDVNDSKIIANNGLNGGSECFDRVTNV